jgi:hypothetical protein
LELIEKRGPMEDKINMQRREEKYNNNKNKASRLNDQ